jgi:hypothetical protein
VIQGITAVKASVLVNQDVLVKLWVHEFQRVFEDRLINEHDKKIIREELAKRVSTSMKSSLTHENLFTTPIVFCNFMKRGL